MKSFLTKITLLFFLLPFIIINSLQAATEQRIALVIGNSAYSSGPLKNPVNDAADMATALKRAGFTVTLKKNANLQEMVETIEDFGNSLKRGGVGLFYYSGHGVQVNNVNYLLPVNVRINKESDVRFQAVDAGRVLAEMENANNGLNIVILDACRDNPFGKSFRSASRGLAIVANAPTGTFISYSTGAGQVARDGESRNSPYTSALIQYMKQPGLAIEDVFKGVRQKLRKETGQVPWELSSLEGKFYFTAPSAPAPATYEPPSAPAKLRRMDIVRVAGFGSAQMQKGAPTGWLLDRKKGEPVISLEKGSQFYYLHMRSDESAYGIKNSIKVDIKEYPYLNWTWKATKLPNGGDVRKSDKDDQAIQIYVAFTPTGFPEAQNTPVLGYIWDNEAPKGWTGRSSASGGEKLRYVVVRNKTDRLGHWYTEKRNIYEDYRKLLKDVESADPAGVIHGVEFYINSQNTRSAAESYIGDVYFSKE